MILPILDLSRERKLLSGERTVMPAAEANTLIARGFARR